MKESEFYLSEQKCKVLFELGFTEECCDIMASKIAINNIVGLPLYNRNFDTSGHYPSMSLSKLESFLPREYDKGALNITMRGNLYSVEYINILTDRAVIFCIGDTMIDAIFNMVCKIVNADNFPNR